MYWTEFLTVALIHLLAVAKPGRDFAVVVRESVTHGRRAGMFTAFGVGTAQFLCMWVIRCWASGLLCRSRLCCLTR